jgi:hypothetical protein
MILDMAVQAQPMFIVVEEKRTVCYCFIMGSLDEPGEIQTI